MALTNSEITAKVHELIAESLGVGEEEIKPNSSFIDDLGADSLDIVELVMLIEKEFKIEIPDEDAEKISTVQDSIDYISAHQAERGGLAAPRRRDRVGGRQPRRKRRRLDLGLPPGGALWCGAAHALRRV